MKIYLASSWKNQATVLEVANALELRGYEVDAFCRSTDKRYSFHWSELVDDEADLANYNAIDMLADPRTQRAFKEDKKWLDWADCIIMIMPSYKIPTLIKARSPYPIRDRYSKGSHYLIYFDWKPTGAQRRLFSLEGVK